MFLFFPFLRDHLVEGVTVSNLMVRQNYICTTNVNRDKETSVELEPWDSVQSKGGRNLKQNKLHDDNLRKGE